MFYDFKKLKLKEEKKLHFYHNIKKTIYEFEKKVSNNDFNSGWNQISNSQARHAAAKRGGGLPAPLLDKESSPGGLHSHNGCSQF